MSELELNALSKALKKGDNTVLSPIFQRYQSYCVDKLIFGKNCPREEAEDIYMEAIINFREKILSDKITFLTDVKFYLSQTCVNMFLVRIKQKKRWERNVPDVQRFFYESEYLIEESEYDHDEAIELAVGVWSALKEKCKDIIHYFYVDKLKMEEIAEIMSFSSADVAKTIKSRCYKKMLELARNMEKKFKS